MKISLRSIEVFGFSIIGFKFFVGIAEALGAARKKCLNKAEYFQGEMSKK